MQLYIRERRMINRNNLVLKAKICIFGYAKLGVHNDLEFYAFHCPVHGVVTDYAHGRAEKMYLCCHHCTTS
jgi:hypothetical protein